MPFPGLPRIEHVADVYRLLPAEDDARRFLEGMIWPEGRRCPGCREGRTTVLPPRGRRAGCYQCCGCRMQFSATSHTPLHGTKLDLRLWVVAIVLLLASSKGISSVALARMLGVTQKTAWRMGHAVRLMMREVGPALAPYEGTVEVDSTFVGGEPRPQVGVLHPRGRGTYRQPVVVAAERGGRARAAPIAGHGVGAVGPFVSTWVAPEATLVSDGDRAMVALGKGRAAHQVVIHGAKAFVDPTTGAHINTVESFASSVERARVGVFHRITGPHLQRYLDELLWRWNHRIPEVHTRIGTGGKIRHQTRWTPWSISAMMEKMFATAIGRGLRRTANYGLRFIEPAVFGG